jgi:hypothetical protein
VHEVGKAWPQVIELEDERRRSWAGDGARPVRVHVWRPATALEQPAPLVAISHGTGGAATQMAWLAEALSEAGFTALAVDHHGNNSVDGYLPQGFAFWWERAVDLSFALDAVTAGEPAGAVGAAGFSLGGYTAAALAGARVAPDRFAALASGTARLPSPPESGSRARPARDPAYGGSGRPRRCRRRQLPRLAGARRVPHLPDARGRSRRGQSRRGVGAGGRPLGRGRRARSRGGALCAADSRRRGAIGRAGCHALRLPRHDRGRGADTGEGRGRGEDVLPQAPPWRRGVVGARSGAVGADARTGSAEGVQSSGRGVKMHA